MGNPFKAEDYILIVFIILALLTGQIQDKYSLHFCWKKSNKKDYFLEFKCHVTVDTIAWERILTKKEFGK